MWFFRKNKVKPNPEASSTIYRDVFDQNKSPHPLAKIEQEIQSSVEPPKKPLRYGLVKLKKLGLKEEHPPFDIWHQSIAGDDDFLVSPADGRVTPSAAQITRDLENGLEAVDKQREGGWLGKVLKWGVGKAPPKIDIGHPPTTEYSDVGQDFTEMTKHKFSDFNNFENHTPYFPQTVENNVSYTLEKSKFQHDISGISKGAKIEPTKVTIGGLPKAEPIIGITPHIPATGGYSGYSGGGSYAFEEMAEGVGKYAEKVGAGAAKAGKIGLVLLGGSALIGAFVGGMGQNQSYAAQLANQRKMMGLTLPEDKIAINS